MDNNNCTPIFYAATLGQDKACELLIRYGSNLHVQDCKGRTYVFLIKKNHNANYTLF